MLIVIRKAVVAYKKKCHKTVDKNGPHANYENS